MREMFNRRIALVILTAALAYGGSYAWFRQSHMEIWSKNGKPYVIFPKGNLALYYGFRPLTYVDGRISGMGFHIGPHQ
jgi:hypothetical protein